MGASGDPVAAAKAAVQAAKHAAPWGAAVVDAQTGAALLQVNAGAAFPPASVTKTITALYALDRLGPDYRFETQVLYRGVIKSGTLHGDLILRGGGDPTLDSDDLATLAAQLRDAGLQSVTGGFYYDDRALPNLSEIDPEQPDHVSYNPAVSGLNLNFNRVYFEWMSKSGASELILDARAQKYRPTVQMAVIRKSDRAKPIFAYEMAAGQDRWSVASHALRGHGGRWLPVRNPGLYAAEVFHSLARSYGISLDAPKPLAGGQGGLQDLARLQSAPVHKLIKDMLKYSTNLTAEVLGLTAGRGSNASLHDQAQSMADWARGRFNLGPVQLVDHSGLGGQSRLRVIDLAQMHAQSAALPVYAGLLKQIYLRGPDGKPRKNHPVKIHAKTGTLNFTSSLTGIMTARDGRQLGFAIMMADVPRRAALPVDQRERPRGGRRWQARARRAQQFLLQDWADRFC